MMLGKMGMDVFETTRPNGCPCPNYDCNANSLFDSVLLLDQKSAVLRSLSGQVFDFGYSVDDDAQANGYCSFTFKNENFVIG